jgi:hypothetical protein
MVKVLFFLILSFLIFRSNNSKISSIRRQLLKHHGHNYLAERNFAQKYNHADNHRGMIMCASNNMVSDVIKMIFQTRYIWKSKFGFALAHCREIDDININILNYIAPDIKIIDICSNLTALGWNEGEEDDIHWTLRGFYCKIGAVILSPFIDTILVDLDVVWFKQPDLLFNSTAYKSTGSLFFRDRTYLVKNEKVFERNRNIYDFFVKHGLNMDETTKDERFLQNGISLFWKYGHSNSQDYPILSDYQDSSVVLINKLRHSKMLGIMKRLLKNGLHHLGYGDKEIFWITATLSGEPFSFSPFLASQYSDCHGVIVHLDPNEAGQYENASPFYSNAEFLVEDAMFVGEFIVNTMSKPILLNPLTKLIHFNSFIKGKLETGCTCLEVECIEVPKIINMIYLYAEWLHLSTKISNSEGDHIDKNKCIKIEYNTNNFDLLTIFFTDFFDNDDCAFVGCPQLPFKINSSNFGEKQLFCDPVYFLMGKPPDSLLILANDARSHNVLDNYHDGDLIQLETYPSIYIYYDKSIHEIPNLATFMTFGKDFSEVKRLSSEDFEYFIMGESIPSVD